MKRRKLLRIALNTLVALPAGWVAWRYIFEAKKQRTEKILLGNPDELFRTVNYLITRVGETDAIVFKRQIGYEAFSMQCTHAQCTLHYGEDAQKFFCPCHGGEFNADGSVAKAPPTLPLRKLVLRERNGMLYLLNREAV